MIEQVQGNWFLGLFGDRLKWRNEGKFWKQQKTL